MTEHNQGTKDQQGGPWGAAGSPGNGSAGGGMHPDQGAQGTGMAGQSMGSGMAGQGMAGQAMGQGMGVQGMMGGAMGGQNPAGAMGANPFAAQWAQFDQRGQQGQQGQQGQFPPFPGPQYWQGYANGAPPPGFAPGYGYGQGPAYPPYPPQGYAPEMGAAAQQGRGPGMAQVMQEIANGGNGLSSLTKLLDFDDKDFWKGALVGAAAVLLLTNDTVQRALFRGAVKGRDAVEEGVETVKQGAEKVKQKVRAAAQEKSDE